ncbi:MAG TPA: hypothetical protein VFE62_13480 [Gemmataceae bacterium]|nr:hypothetical protein [Gemmataceae bacterium]
MRPELAKYQAEIDVLVSFIEGRLDGPALDAALATEEMKTLLGTFENPRYPASSNHYRQLHNKQDRSTLGGLVNSEGIIENFLRQAEVSFQAVKRFGSLHRLILAALPAYLDPPMEFLVEKIVPADDAMSETQKKKVIKERLKEYFKCAEKPPKWIQNADWPIRDGKPLFFVGQLAINASELFHDKGAVYVFFDPAKGSFETVAQFY